MERVIVRLHTPRKDGMPGKVLHWSYADQVGYEFTNFSNPWVFEKNKEYFISVPLHGTRVATPCTGKKGEQIYSLKVLVQGLTPLARKEQ